MDLLCSLGLEELPEQATRLTSHPGVIKALETNSDARLGFNLCCNCGTKLDAPDDDIKPKSSEKSNEASKVVKCKGCQRVRYCSDACYKADSEEVSMKTSSNLEEGAAFGHSAVICSLLRLCNDDEDAEEELFEGKANDTKSYSKKKGNKEAATYRMQTERESYPATLFNVLAESPTGFIEAMTRRIRYLEDPRSPEKQRRGKRDRVASHNNPMSFKTGNKHLVVHVVGASTDSELWGWCGKNESSKHAEVLGAYAEASSNILSYLDSFPILLESIRLIFIGPDCPKYCKVKVPIPESKTVLTIETHCCNYGEHNQTQASESIPSPDVVVFFNPGFSCPDYDWSKALSVAASPSKVDIGCSTPFLVTTNTEMECFADIKCMLDGGYIDAMSLPSDILEAVDYPVPKARKHETIEEDVAFFFGENPYHGLRVRQSGTMANDVYVKSRWMFGGLFKKTGAFKKRKSKECDEEDEDMHKQAKKKHRGGNSKKSNPALI